MNKLGWPAPAKLNLFLHITGRRSDGYHEIQTVFQLLDWGDVLNFSVTKDGRIGRRNELPGIPETEDLSLRAARLLQGVSGSRRGVEIALDKRIPPGSGLGGGSSDAATVLHALNVLWDCGLSIAELAELGLSLGADVPVFVHGQSAWAEGIGERLTPLSLGDTWYVLVFPEISISTAEVFRDPGLKCDRSPVGFSSSATGLTGNDCEPVVLKLYPRMQEIMQELSCWGVPRLTGTGSCIFIVCNGKNQADDTTRQLKCRYNVRAVRGVDRSSLLKKVSERD